MVDKKNPEDLEHKDWAYFIDGLHVSKNEFGIIEIDIEALENNGYKIIFYGDRES